MTRVAACAQWAHTTGPDGVKMADLQCVAVRDVFKRPLLKGLEDKRELGQVAQRVGVLAA